MTFFGFSDDATETKDDTIWNAEDTRTTGIGLAPSGELWAHIAQPIADCIAHILKTVLEVADAIFEFTMTSNGQIESLKEGLSNVTGSEFGKWPEAKLA